MAGVNAETLMTMRAAIGKGQLTIPVSVEGRMSEMVVDTRIPCVSGTKNTCS